MRATAATVTLLIVASLPASAKGQFLGPSPYLGAADSPFAGGQFDYFHLEDFEDGALNTPGVAASAGTVLPPGALTDSVDADSGVIDGSGTSGRSFFSSGQSQTIEFTFNAGTLGQYPTHAGLVWTDVGFATPATGFDGVTFEAFDAADVSLGVIGPVTLGDGVQSGTTAEDRFFGVIHAGGVRRIRITMATSTDWEIDHLQYGFTAGPQLLGPSPYLSVADSPFAGGQFDFFHLEDFEDGALNTPGVAASAGTVLPPGALTDSVDADSGVIDGSGTSGRSFFSSGQSQTIEFTFNAVTLGQYPTHAGLVWTDVGFATPATGFDGVTFEAFDAADASLGVIGPVTLGDGVQSGTTAEDRFFGVIHAGGVRRIRITMATSTDWEIDHVQYGGRLPRAPGDLNCDGHIDGRDIQAFAEALLDPAGYPSAYPGCNIRNGDLNASGTPDAGDAPLLVQLLLVGP